MFAFQKYVNNFNIGMAEEKFGLKKSQIEIISLLIKACLY